MRELGGVVEDMDVEGDEASVAEWGRFKLCRDDQGSPFGLHQPPTPAPDGPGARSHSEDRVGCMVWSTTASSSPWRASRSTWSRRRAANPSTVRAASSGGG